MTPVEKVSIGGYPFTLEQDAMFIVRRYLSELQEHYSSREGGSEIMEGIEERFAEHLMERCGRDGVASVDTVNAIIDILGRPEAIEGETPEDSSQAKGETSSEGGDSAPRQETSRGEGRTSRKKLFRDIDGKMISGVCSGLASYFDVSVAIMRLIFVAISVLIMAYLAENGTSDVFAILSPIVLYVVLAVCIPPAKTVSDRCQLRGEDGTVRDIEKNVQEIATDIQDAVGKIGKGDAWKDFGTLGGKILGVLLLVIGVAGGFFIGVVTLGGEIFGTGELYRRVLVELSNLSPSLVGVTTLFWVRMIILLVAFLPFLWCLYEGLKLLCGFRSPRWHPGLVILILWLVALTACAVLTLVCIIPYDLP